MFFERYTQCHTAELSATMQSAITQTLMPCTHPFVPPVTLDDRTEAIEAHSLTLSLTPTVHGIRNWDLLTASQPSDLGIYSQLDSISGHINILQATNTWRHCSLTVGIQRRVHRLQNGVFTVVCKILGYTVVPHICHKETINPVTP
jgi:hypothetical protein